MKSIYQLVGSVMLVGAAALSTVAHGADVQTLSVTSTFENGSALPKKYSCQGADVSPPLTISDIPANAKSLVLIHDDPDAPKGTWVHWVLYDIPVTGETVNLPEDASDLVVWEDGTKHGKNSWGDPGYGGACPPKGTHEYRFNVYALDTVLDLRKRRFASKVKREMKPHVIAKGRLTATYSK